jgi:actin-related protein 10
MHTDEIFYRSLKTGGTEVSREKWDEADPNREVEDMVPDLDEGDRDGREGRGVLPDWTRSPLPLGAPYAGALIVPPTPTPVGA